MENLLLKRQKKAGSNLANKIKDNEYAKAGYAKAAEFGTAALNYGIDLKAKAVNLPYVGKFMAPVLTNKGALAIGGIAALGYGSYRAYKHCLVNKYNRMYDDFVKSLPEDIQMDQQYTLVYAKSMPHLLLEIEAFDGITQDQRTKLDEIIKLSKSIF